MDNSIRFSLPANLADLRKRIDAVDEAILGLVAERVELVRLVQKLKRMNGLPVRNYEREEEIFARARRIAYRLGMAGDNAVAIVRQCIAFCLDSAGTDEEADSLNAG